MLATESIHHGQHLAAETFRIGAISVETQELHCVFQAESSANTSTLSNLGPRLPLILCNRSRQH